MQREKGNYRLRYDYSGVKKHSAGSHWAPRAVPSTARAALAAPRQAAGTDGQSSPSFHRTQQQCKEETKHPARLSDRLCRDQVSAGCALAFSLPRGSAFNHSVRVISYRLRCAFAPALSPTNQPCFGPHCTPRQLFPCHPLLRATALNVPCQSCCIYPTGACRSLAG